MTHHERMAERHASVKQERRLEKILTQNAGDALVWLPV